MPPVPLDLPMGSCADVKTRLNQIGEQNGRIAANHTLTYTRAAVNWCLRAELYDGENPWAYAEKFKTRARERFLQPEELQRFFTALSLIDADFRDYIYVSLFTGARRTNVLSMKWSEIDFDLATWRIPVTKNNDSHLIPLTNACMEILRARYDCRKSDTWVFAGEGKTGHLVEPKRAWAALLRVSGLQDLRLHDLRRTLGSYMAMGNQSLHIIGKVLGHRSPTATQIYSRMTVDPIRAAMEKAHADMLQAAKTAHRRHA